MPIDYHRIVLPFVEEAIGLATLLIPEPKAEEIKIVTDVEAAELNTERIKLVKSELNVMKKLLFEIKENSPCPKCIKKTAQALETLDASESVINELEKEIPQFEQIARLRRDLRELLDHVKEGLPLLTEQQMKGLEPEKVEGEKKE